MRKQIKLTLLNINPITCLKHVRCTGFAHSVYIVMKDVELCVLLGQDPVLSATFVTTFLFCFSFILNYQLTI